MKATRYFVQRIFAGFIVLLPVILTAALVVWLSGVLKHLAGPESVFGRIASWLGSALVSDQVVAYVIGTMLVVAMFFLAGLLVMSNLQSRLKALLNSTIGRVPIIGSVFNLIERFVELIDRKEDVDLKSMAPVWVFFGGKRGAAVLALLPTTDTVCLEDSNYCGVLVPSAPVPFGGGLIFVPRDWVKPAGFGVEALTNIYVSMGLSAPRYQNATRSQAAETNPTT